MPKVLIELNGKFFKDEFINDLARGIRPIVAWALSTQFIDGRLTENDIEVRVDKYGQFDVHNFPLEITVLANDYEQRRENIDERCEKITREVERMGVGREEFFVWVLLAAGSFKTGKLTG